MGEEAAMSKTGMVLWRIAGSVVGLLVGGLALGALFIALFYRHDSGDEYDLLEFIFFGGLGLLVGATLGAATGATVAQKLLRQRSSFRKTLLGAVVGLPIAVLCAWTGFGILFLPIPIVAGAVIGSGWKAKAANAIEAQN
jgi:hypothetical protein